MSKKKHRKKHSQSFKKKSSQTTNETANASTITPAVGIDEINATSEVKKILIIMGIMVAVVIIVAIVNAKTSAISDLGERLLNF